MDEDTQSHAQQHDGSRHQTKQPVSPHDFVLSLRRAL
jgi:hypothetical protein